jgi:transposase InsO family protein
MDHYKEQILACDFFTVETIWLQTIYVLFFIELGSRRVHFSGITTNPNEIWITQQARQLVWAFSDREKPLRFLIHDKDRKFSKAFDTVFESAGIHVIHTPFRAPNAYAERWVRTVREECLDYILIMNTNHLKRVLVEFSDYYNTSRSHQGIDQQTPVPRQLPSNGTIHRKLVLGGIINDYYQKPLRTALSTT